MRDVFLLGSCRTPIGRFGGSLQAVPAASLLAHTARAAIRRSGVAPGSIEEVLAGNVIQAGNGLNVARQAALETGLDQAVTGLTVNMVCGSGLRAIIDAARSIQLGEAEVILAGGTESMSRAPYLLPSGRWGARLGSAELQDSVLRDGLEDPSGYHMGETAERLVELFGITREEQDAFAAESQRRAGQAAESRWFEAELEPVTLATKKGATEFARDEHPRLDSTFEALSRLKPVFQENGSVTAGNSSGICDGAAAVVVCSGEALTAQGLTPEARLTGWAYAGCDPKTMGLGPAVAVPKLLARTGQSLDAFAAIELNEAFAAQALAVIRELGLDQERVNQHGGAVALGHPLGASGARIVVTLLGVLRRRGGGAGLATLCCGGGMGVALSLEAT